MELSAKVIAVYTAKQEDYPRSTAVPRLTLTWDGIEGERHFGRTRRADARVRYYPKGSEIANTRQVTILSEEELAEIAAAMGLAMLDATLLSGNVVLRGVSRLTRLPAGTRLQFSGGAALICDGENLPCSIPGRAIAAAFPERQRLGRMFAKSAIGRRGVTAWVEHPGEIAAGDEVLIRIAAQYLYRPESML